MTPSSDFLNFFGCALMSAASERTDLISDGVKSSTERKSLPRKPFFEDGVFLFFTERLLVDSDENFVVY
jgi:hypothetical protein